jgi:hypothetical protein
VGETQQLWLQAKLHWTNSECLKETVQLQPFGCPRSHLQPKRGTVYVVHTECLCLFSDTSLNQFSPANESNSRWDILGHTFQHPSAEYHHSQFTNFQPWINHSLPVTFNLSNSFRSNIRCCIESQKSLTQVHRWHHRLHIYDTIICAPRGPTMKRGNPW